MPSNKVMKVRVRFAPSPTGFLHLGGARTALFNWLFARNKGGVLILRVEDTDIARAASGAVEKIISDLKWLGVNWDEGPYFQTDRLSLYSHHAELLLKNDKAYFCYCLPEELDARRKEALAGGKPPGYDGRCRELSIKEAEKLKKTQEKRVIRFKIPHTGATEFTDLVRGEIKFDHSVLDDFVIMKSDGIPTFIFANVVDDEDMKITHVIRGDEHLSNTPRQLLLYRALGWQPPFFAHLSMILGTDGKKLSKRTGAVSLSWYRREGYLPEALINYLALLGWAPEGNQEIFSSTTEIIKKFSLKRISCNPAIFDVKKLDWINGNYIKRSNCKEIAMLIKPYLEAANLLQGDEDEEWLEQVIELEKGRIKRLSQIVEYGDFFFLPEISYEKDLIDSVLLRKGTKELLGAYRTALSESEDFTVEEVEKRARKVIEDAGVKGGDLIHPVRVALTGHTIGPGLFEIIALLGKKKVLHHLDSAIKIIKAQNE
jgi:glutamyl-tRNA synthetase